MSTDKQLIRAIIKKGSDQAADQLVRRYYDDLYYYLYRQVGNRDDALDMTQEAFIAALNGLSSYQPRKASFKTWLYRIGTYKVIDSRRKQKESWLELEESAWVESHDVVERLFQQQLLADINTYVGKYQPEIQEIFQLRIYGKLSFPEIAGIIMQKEEKVKAQYYRLTKKIREEFANHV